MTSKAVGDPPCDHDSLTPCPPVCHDAKEQWRRDVAQELVAIQKAPLTADQRAWNCASSSCLPAEGEVVETKIDDAKGCRNEARLKRRGRLWYFEDDSMYVYYTPTHWRPVT